MVIVFYIMPFIVLKIGLYMLDVHRVIRVNYSMEMFEAEQACANMTGNLDEREQEDMEYIWVCDIWIWDKRYFL